jgi:GNAT superfamily N-acetyltransferase
VAEIVIEKIERDRGKLCDSILRSLPRWFGIEKAIVDYARAAEGLPTFVARINGETAGFLSLEFHNPHSAEIHVMAVRESFHRRGVGRALVSAAEEHARREGAEFFLVKTLAPSARSEEYERTRRFYESVGFKPLQEFKTLWSEHNPCLLMGKALRAQA